MTANTTLRVAASGVRIQADTSNKNEPNAPTPSTTRATSTTAGTAVDIATGYKIAGIYRIGIKFSITLNGETFTKNGHTTNNYINIKKVKRNIVATPAAVTIDPNSTGTFVVTTWDDLDSSATTANILSASVKGTVSPTTATKGTTITVTTGRYGGKFNVNITIPETDNYLSETKQVPITINTPGNGIWWYNGTE